MNPGVTNHMKLAIADSSDYILDSNVFLKAESLVSCRENGLEYLQGSPAAGAASGAVHQTGEPLVGSIDPQIQALLHDLNCNVVVPTEASVDSVLSGL